MRTHCLLALVLTVAACPSEEPASDPSGGEALAPAEEPEAGPEEKAEAEAEAEAKPEDGLEKLSDRDLEARAKKPFEATLRIDEEPEADGFQGVWLDRDDGEHWLISYRSRNIWEAFAGKRLRIYGSLYGPAGEARDAPHMMLQTFEVIGEGDPSGLGPEINVAGKLEGKGEEARFVTSDKRYRLFDVPEWLAAGREMTIRGRVVQRPGRTEGDEEWFWAGREEPKGDAKGKKPKKNAKAQKIHKNPKNPKNPKK